MKPFLFFILFSVIVFSCNNPAKTNTITKPDRKDDSAKAMNVSQVDTTPVKYIPRFTNYIFDTVPMSIGTKYSDEDSAKPKHWSQLNDFYSVYRFGPDMFCIGIQLSDNGTATVVDSLYMATTQGKSTFDTTNHDEIIDTGGGSVVFQESKKFSQTMFKNDTTRWFYVYCTHGLTRAKVGRVLYSNNGCIYFVALQLFGIEIDKFGMPQMASLKKINLTYSTKPDFQYNLNEYSKFMFARTYSKGGYDWMNSIPPKQFAYNDSLFFTSTDDFMQWLPTDTNHIYPERRIFMVVDNKVYDYYISDVDFFGIPCD